MLLGIAVLTVWVPRRVGFVIDDLVAGRLTGAVLWRELAILVAMGVAIYLLRVGWRLQLFRAAFRLGVELRVRLYERLSLQGPPFFHRQRTGDLMALATNDVDAVEMAAGEAFLAAFDGTLTLVLVVAMMTLGVDWRLGIVALLPFPFMAWAFWVISTHVHGAWRAVARPLLQPQRARAGNRGRGPHAARAGTRIACRAATSASARNARRTQASTRRNGRRPTSPRSGSRSPWRRC